MHFLCVFIYTMYSVFIYTYVQCIHIHICTVYSYTCMYSVMKRYSVIYYCSGRPTWRVLATALEHQQLRQIGIAGKIKEDKGL